MVEAGVTDNVKPDPTDPTPHDVEYHCQLAPAPNDPPTMPNVVELPWHNGFTDAVALVAAVESELTVMSKLTHDVVLQVPSART